MKVLVNGGLNLSELDGWWAEAYSPEVGWAIGDGQEHGDDPAWDAVEAGAVYELLERHVVPEFYTREDSGIPLAWVNRMRESMARLTPRFSANRAVREYTERHYLPAALAFGARITDKGELGKQMIDWQRDLDWKWSALHFGVMKVETVDGKHVFEIQVYLNNLAGRALRGRRYGRRTSQARDESNCPARGWRYGRPYLRGDGLSHSPERRLYSEDDPPFRGRYGSARRRADSMAAMRGLTR